MMTQVFNKKNDTIKRQILRNNNPTCERQLWAHLKNKQLGFRFRRQFGIGPYVVDFYCPKFRLVVEIDGPSHDIKDDVIRQTQI